MVVASYTGTSYTNIGLANGTTYYYVVAGTNSGGLGPNSPEASATPDVIITFTSRSLTWKGDGLANLWNVSGAANWVTNGVATIFNSGDTVTFNNTGSNNVPVTLAGTLQPALVTINASKNYTLSGAGSMAGTNTLINAGSGTLTINTTNTYSGGTILSNGTTVLGSIGANPGGLGPAPSPSMAALWNSTAGAATTARIMAATPTVLPCRQPRPERFTFRSGFLRPDSPARSPAAAR